MSDTLNLAGKNIIVDHITTNDGMDAMSLIQAAIERRNKLGVVINSQAVAQNTQAIASQGQTIATQGETIYTQGQAITKINNSLPRIGAKVVSGQINIFAYNPLNAYSSVYTDDFYVETGYSNCNGQPCPVYIPNKHLDRTPHRDGTFCVVIYKANVQDEAWSVEVVFPHPNSNAVLVWEKTDSTSFTIDTSVWVIGSFVYCSDPLSTKYGITSVYMNRDSLTPMSFLKNRFMDILNDAAVADSASGDFTNWALAMECDEIFKRLAVLELFVGKLFTRYLDVGNGTDEPGGGFFMHIHDAINNTPPEIIAKYDGNTLWEIDPITGKMYGNFAKVRQYMPWQFDDSLDDSYPMECDFYIPANAVIVSIKLSSKGKNYRAYSKSAASSGGTKTSGVVADIPDFTRTALDLTVTKNAFHGIETVESGTHKHSYSKTTSVGGSSDGTHSHTAAASSSWQAAEITSSDPIYGSSVANHKHTVKFAIQNDGGHSHSTIGHTDANTDQTGEHKHYLPDDSVVTGVTLNTSASGRLTNAQIDHTHNVDISHTHSLEFGIYESTSPNGVELKCSNDGGSNYGSAISGMGTGGDVSNLDITSSFSGTGWKAIKFTSTRLGRIQAQLILELLVTT